MNWQIFGIIGYLSLILSMAALASWLLYWAKPKRLFANAGLLLALAAFIAANINSSGYVSRIEIDPAEKLAELEARQKAKEQALINSRSDEVAQISFAEDGQGEFLDTAGMDETDLKYLKAISESDTPDWKNGKKARGSADSNDNSLEGLIGADEASEGADVAELEAEAPRDPILLDESSVTLARKADRWNLKVSEYFFYFAIIILVIDYLRRANLYQEASPPIPLPSAWLNAFTSAPVVQTLPAKPRRSTLDELKWLTRRGDAFIYFTADSTIASKTQGELADLKKFPFRLDLIRVDERPHLTDEFIFESLWYGRASFIVDSPERAQQLIDYAISRLEKRKKTKSSCPQTAHFVWDMNTPLPENSLQAFERCADSSGLSLTITSASI